jgi:small multidrug resistance pump
METPCLAHFSRGFSAVAGDPRQPGRPAALPGENMNHVYLLVAIVFEVLATTALKQTDGFTRLLPSIVTIAGYGFAFYFLALTLRVMPVGVVYAIWSGAGIVFITAIGWLWFRQTLDLPAIIGICLIVAGVLVINLMSKTMAH